LASSMGTSRPQVKMSTMAVVCGRARKAAACYHRFMLRAHASYASVNISHTCNVRTSKPEMLPLCRACIDPELLCWHGDTGAL